jgi:hypothetical protein
MALKTKSVPAGAAFALAANGCLVMSGESVDESGVKIPGTTLQQIDIGTTRVDWLVATLGEPNSRCAVESRPGVEILRYDFEPRTGKGGTVFLIFAGGSEKSVTERTYFEVTDGVVTKYWKEA